jgi:DNA-binding CsgD family transcriptional regulator
MASSNNEVNGAGRSAPSLDREAMDVVRKSSLPALVLQIPDETILAASGAARELLGREGETVEGRSFEDFTADEPSGGLDLMLAGRLQGYETSRQLRSSDAGTVPSRIWVRGFDDDIPPRCVLTIISTDAAATPTQVPVSVGADLAPVIGTADENLTVDRVSSDVEALLRYRPDELLGQSILSLVSAEDVPKWLAAIAQATIARAGVTMSIRARPATGPPVLCDALVLAMSPPPSCAFALMPRSDDRDRQSAPDVREQLTRLSRGVSAVTLSADLASTPALRRVPRLAQLSARELDIVRRLLGGDRVPAIAAAVFLSQSTVRNHLARVYRKLGVGSQQELINLLRDDDTGSPDRGG